MDSIEETRDSQIQQLMEETICHRRNLIDASPNNNTDEIQWQQAMGVNTIALALLLNLTTKKIPGNYFIL